jgi:hypothetical protein
MLRCRLTEPEVDSIIQVERLIPLQALGVFASCTLGDLVVSWAGAAPTLASQWN